MKAFDVAGTPEGVQRIERETAKPAFVKSRISAMAASEAERQERKRKAIVLALLRFFHGN